MWRLALAAALVVVLALALAFAVASQTDSPAATPEGSASPAPPSLESPAPTVGPSGPTAGQPRPPVIDPAYPGTLRPGDWVMITGTASCLNMRFDPRMPPVVSDNTTYDNVLNCLPDGFVGRLAADGWMGSPSVPVHTDGRWWWQIVGQGWAAEEFLTFDHYGGLPFPERPDLAGAGLIAYMRPDHGLWLMNADGSNHRQVAAGGTDAGGLNEYIETFQWSPLGDRLAVGLRNQGGATVTRIIDLAGRLLIEVNGLGQPRWSPDGRRLSGIRTVPLVGAYQATPFVFDVDTNRDWPVGPPTFGYTASAWSPDGESLAFLCASGHIAQPDGTVVAVESASCHGDGLRVVSADGSNARILLRTTRDSGWYISSPSWSPSGGTIAVTSAPGEGGGVCRGYAFVDVASGALNGCVPVPEEIHTGGDGGGFGISDSSWAPDGRLVFTAQDVGQSGIFVHDPVTGARAVVPSINAGPASISSDGTSLTFASGGYIWVAGLDGSNLTLLAEGNSPVWQPLP